MFLPFLDIITSILPFSEKVNALKRAASVSVLTISTQIIKLPFRFILRKHARELREFYSLFASIRVIRGQNNISQELELKAKCEPNPGISSNSAKSVFKVFVIQNILDRTENPYV